eukprot:c22278_g1_i1 orf=287-2170(+)
MCPVVESSPGALGFALPSKKQQLQKTFDDLDCHLAALASCVLQWRDVEDYLAGIEETVQRRLGELAEKERAFEVKVSEREEALKKREEGVFVREQESIARVQEQKDVAIAAILEEKRNWNEEWQRLQPASADSDSKTGRAALDRAVDNHVAQIKKEMVGTSNEDLKDLTPTVLESSESSKSAEGCATPSQSEAKESVIPATKINELKVRQQLKQLCENTNGDGLRKYMVDRRKEVSVLRAELPSALQSAEDPAQLVLSALEGYYFPGQGPNQVEKKESGVSANRRACILLLECLAEALADPVLGAEFPVVPPNIKESAKELADQWKCKMNLQTADLLNNSLDAQAFLQLLATFGIASEYDDCELCRLVTAVARRRQTPALCRALGLTAKMPEIVDQLANDGKQMEAISLAHAFSIMDRIQPGPLLKAYVKEARKSAQSILKTGSNSQAAQNESTTKELIALKNVLKCIEEFHLEAECPSAPLQKRVVQLEKTKLDRKRVAVAVKAQAKRPRATNGTNHGGLVLSVPAERSYYRPPERAQYGGVGVTAYNLALPSNYDRRSQGAYGASYGGGNRSPIALGSYIYTTDGLGSSVYGSAAYGNPTATYGSYQFGSGLAPPPPTYQAPFLR